MFKILLLFWCTALCEIVGCWLPYLWLRHGKSAWYLLPATLALCMFVYLLTLHPQASGRIYAAYGGVYIGTALIWLWLVDGVSLQPSDYLGVGLCLCGAMVIMFGKAS